MSHCTFALPNWGISSCWVRIYTSSCTREEKEASSTAFITHSRCYCKIWRTVALYPVFLLYQLTCFRHRRNTTYFLTNVSLSYRWQKCKMLLKISLNLTLITFSSAVDIHPMRVVSRVTDRRWNQVAATAAAGWRYAWRQRHGIICVLRGLRWLATSVSTSTPRWYSTNTIQRSLVSCPTDPVYISVHRTGQLAVRQLSNPN